MLHHSNNVETITYLIKEYLYKNLVIYIKNNIKKTHLKAMYELCKEEIKEQEYYDDVKKSKHYISSPTTCSKLIEEFISSKEL
jgi:predicted RND superfamily exporter protein